MKEMNSGRDTIKDTISAERDLSSKYTDNKFSSILNNLTSKFNLSNYQTSKQHNKIFEQMCTMDFLNCRDLLTHKDIFIDTNYSRFGRLRMAEQIYNLQKINQISNKKKTSKQQHNNNEKYQNILKQVYNLYEISELKASTNKSFNIKETYEDIPYNIKKQHLNSHEDKLKTKKKINITKSFNNKYDDSEYRSLNSILGLKNSKNTDKFFSTELSEIKEANPINILNRELTKMQIEKGSQVEKSNKRIQRNKQIINSNSNDADLKIPSVDLNRLLYNRSISPKMMLQNIQKIVLKGTNKLPQEYTSDSSHTKSILPKVYVRDMNIDRLPEKVDIYSKLKVKDIIKFSKLKKVPFK